MRGVNYRDTFISVAPDSTAERADTPRLRAGKPTVAQLQLEMLRGRPYEFTSEDVLFATSAEGRRLHAIDKDKRLKLQQAYFKKPRACLRASPLPKQFGWGLHFDSHGRVAAYGVETDEYRELQVDPSLQQLEAMRSRRS